LLGGCCEEDGEEIKGKKRNSPCRTGLESPYALRGYGGQASGRPLGKMRKYILMEKEEKNEFRLAELDSNQRPYGEKTICSTN
jgi:hypothetical protein